MASLPKVDHKQLKVSLLGMFSLIFLFMTSLGCSIDSNILNLARTLKNQIPVHMDSPVSSPSNITAIPVNLVFGEDIEDINAADIQVTGGTLSGLTGSGSVYSFVITPNGDGVVRVYFPTQSLTVKALSAESESSVKSTSSSVLQWIVDTSRPSVILSTELTSPTSLPSIPVSVTFSESVSGLEVSDFVLSGGASIIGFSGSGQSYQLTLLPTISGIIEIELPAGSAVDQANNASLASNKLSITYDTNFPLPVLSSAVTSPTNLSSINVNVSFGSISVTGLEESDFVLSNATIAGLAGSGSNYTLSLIPSSDGTVTVQLPANVVANAFNTQNLASNVLSWVVNRVAPTLSLSGPTPSVGNHSTSFVWTLNYSGATQISLDSSDISVGGGGSSGCTVAVAGSGNDSRTVTVSGCPGNGSLNISVDEGSARDAAGNLVAAVGPSTSATVDNTGPLLNISGPNPSVGNSSSDFQWTVTYAADATQVSLSSGDVSLSGTAAASCASPVVADTADVRVKTITVGQCLGNGSLGLSLAADTARDTLGNASLAATASTLATVNNIGPALAVGAVTPALGNTSTVFRWPLSYSGANAISLSINDITLTGTVGTAGCVVQIDNPGGTTQRYIEVTGCTNAGTLGISIAADTASDIAGNGANAAVSASMVVIDNTAFTSSLASNTSSNTNATTIPVTVSFSSATSSFTETDLLVSGATVSNFAGSGMSYSFNLTAMTEGQAVSVQIPASRAQDAYGNNNVASNVLSFNIDRTRPTLAITGPTPVIGNSTATFQWTVAYAGADTISLTHADVNLGGATAGCGVPTVAFVDATTATVAVTGCTGNGSLNIQLDAATAQDLAGNQALASAVSSDATVDNIRPLASITGPNPLVGKSTTSFVWTVSYTGADQITLASEDVTLGGAVVGCGEPVVTSINATTSTVSVVGCTGNGALNIQVAADTARDSAGNRALASAVSSDATVDNIAPTLTISGPSPNAGRATSSFVWTVDYVGASAISLANGNISFEGTATAGCLASVSSTGTYQRSVTVTGCSGDGTSRIQIAAGTAVDSAGNLAGEQNTSLYATVDNTGPLLSIAGPATTLGNSSSNFQWTVTYAADASTISLGAGNVLPSGTAAASCGSPVIANTANSQVKTITFSNCTGNGTLGFSLTADTARDVHGNTSLAATAGATATVDNTAPTLAIAPPTPNIGNSSKTFSWLLTYADATQILLNSTNAGTYIGLSGATANCALSVADVSGTERRVDVSGCTGNGSLNIVVSAGSARDGAGNVVASNSSASAATVDNIIPSISVAAPNVTLAKSTTNISWVLTYSENVTFDLTADDVTLTGAATGCVTSISGSGLRTRTVSVLGCSGDGSLGFTLAANSAVDYAGNEAGAFVLPVAREVTIDNTPPSITIGNANVTQGYLHDRLTWEVSYTGASSVGLTIANIILIGDSDGCVTTVTGSGLLTRTVTLKGCTGHTNVGISIAAGTAQDAIANVALAAGPSNTVKLMNPIQVNFAFSADVVEKTAGVVAHTIPIVLEKALPVSVAVKYKILGQTTAVNPTNYNLTSGSVVIPAGQTTANISYNYQGSSSNSKLVQVALTPEFNNGYNLTIGSRGIFRRLVKDDAAADSTYSQTSVGNAHACAVTPAGALLCWGQNGQGQLGNGTTTDSSVPVTIATTGYASVSAGYNHTCAITTQGSLRCWGSNGFSQIGNNITTNSNVPVVIGSGYASVSAGSHHTCAITTAGGLRCWGNNANGQVGTGGTAVTRTPYTIASSGYTKVSAGATHSCAVTTAGGLQCWGYNLYGQLGTGNKTSYTVPMTIAANGYANVSSASNHTCALTTTGGIRCWGLNSSGQLGDGTQTESLVPTTIFASGYASVEAATTYTCGVTTGSELYCWGANSSSQMGPIGTSSINPIKVNPGSFASVAVGSLNLCAISTTGSMQCSGTWTSGQLGSDSIINSMTPRTVGSGFESLASGPISTCAITTGGGVHCWGSNVQSVLGIGSSINSQVPIEILPSGITSITMTTNNTCALSTSGSVQCWGQNVYGLLNDASITRAFVPVTMFSSGYSSISAGWSYACMLTPAGGLQCWGQNSYGQLGNNSVVGSSVPVTLASSGYAKVSAGHAHACAITTGGGLQCWGYNYYGQVGNNSTTNALVPVTLASSGYASVSSGRNHTCAITTGGSLRCWGDNEKGQLGDGSVTNSSVPVTIAASGYSKVVAGFTNTCAITTSGGLRCWGSNSGGQLANGNTTDSSTPVTIATSGYKDVSMGDNHVCAITTAGVLQCWGANSQGQLGLGNLLLDFSPVSPKN